MMICISASTKMRAKFFQKKLYLQCRSTSKVHFDAHQLVHTVEVRMYTVAYMKPYKTLTSVHVFAIYKLFLHILVANDSY